MVRRLGKSLKKRIFPKSAIDPSSKRDPLFFAATGMDYYLFFQHLVGQRELNWYLEIGCRSGDVLKQVNGKCIGVDPYFLISQNVMGAKQQLILCQETSDKFFAGSFIETLQPQISLAFLDGMHLVEYLLRDFINVEKFMSSEGVVLMHDVLPSNEIQTTRDLEDIPRMWTGDVWKLIPILSRYRPDLDIELIDAYPTGLLSVRNLDPQNTVLSDKYDEIIAEFVDIDILEFGPKEILSGLTPMLPEAYLAMDVLNYVSTPMKTVPEFVTP